MKVSVIVPAFNEERLLPRSLAGIRTAMEAFRDAGWASELIVCDNNSTDRTAAIASEAGALVVFEPINQIARARNSGAAKATGDWLVFIDADSFPTAPLFGDVVEAVEGGRCLAGGSTVAVDTPNRIARVVVAWWNATSRVVGWGAGCFVFCEAAAFRRLGGFSERWFAAEEIDLFRRLKRAARRDGRRIVILHRHSILTSDRKAQLYTVRETLGFYARLVFTAGRALRTREGTFMWYDGRR